jgi:hypothetical protein
MSSSDLEETSARDWADVGSRLAAWLTSVPAGDTVIFAMPSPYDDVDGTAPYVQLAVEADGSVRGEAASNNYLDDRLALEDARIAALETMGWLAPTCGVDEEPDDGSANFFVNLELPEDADRLADLLVASLRDVFGVPHPSFLMATGFGSGGRLDSEAMPFGVTVCAAETPAAETPAAEHTAVVAEDVDDLRDLVEAALSTVVDHELTYDSDGDIPIHVDGAIIFVRVEEDHPSIRVFSPLLGNVRWTPRVGSTLSDINRRARYAKIIFDGGVLLATMQLYAEPFVPEHLCVALEGIRLIVNDVVDDLQETLGGDTFATGATSESPGEESA